MALIRPVTTSTLGRWVASTRWMPGGARQLGDPDDRLLDVARGDHHQVGQLVDDDQQVRVGRQDALGVRRDGQRPRAHRAVEVVDVPEPEVREVVVAGVHLADDPLQRLGGLLGVGDDGGDQVRDALVGGQLDPLGVDQHHPDLGRRGAHEDAGDQGVDAAGLARTGGPGDQDVRHLREVGADVAALDVLAEADEQRVVVGLRRRRPQRVAQGDHLAVGVGDLDADRALARDRATGSGCRTVATA